MTALELNHIRHSEFTIQGQLLTAAPKDTRCELGAESLPACCVIFSGYETVHEAVKMSRYRQSDSSFEEIVEGKARRREELMEAIRSADPEVLDEAAERLREAMRKRNPSQRRQRLGPPAFCK